MPRMWTTVSKQTRMKMHKIMTYFVHHNVIQSREKQVKGFLIQVNGSIVMESYEDFFHFVAYLEYLNFKRLHNPRTSVHNLGHGD